MYIRGITRMNLLYICCFINILPATIQLRKQTYKLCNLTNTKHYNQLAMRLHHSRRIYNLNACVIAPWTQRICRRRRRLGTNIVFIFILLQFWLFSLFAERHDDGQVKMNIKPYAMYIWINAQVTITGINTFSCMVNKK